MKPVQKIYSAMILLSLSVLLAACSGVKGGGGSNGGGGSGGGVGPYTLGGSVTGLTVATNSVVLVNSFNKETVTVTGNGTFVFTTKLPSSTTYTVSVMTQPANPSEACSVTNASGTATTNISNVLVSCTAGAFVIGGNVTGLKGTGLTLQNNGADNLSIGVPGGSFTFPTPVTMTNPGYSVTVQQQPTNPSQTCVVTGGVGTATSNVGNVSVTCSTGTIHIGGSIAGFAGGAGMTLLDNGGDTFTVTANGNFTFATLLPSGTNYTVTVGKQPTGPAQTCTVSNNTGVATADINSVQVLCPAVFHTIGGQVVGLQGTNGGLVLQDNFGDNLPLTGNGAFTFATPVAHGSPYEASVFVAPNTQPQGARLYFYKGTALSDVNNISIDFGHNDWAWLGGSNLGDQYETFSPVVPPVTTQILNTPGGVLSPATWTDHSGRLWMFSGYGFTVPAAGTLPEYFNEMWVYQSTWGSSGYEGDLSDFWQLVKPPAPPLPPSPVPIGRTGAVTWTAPSGNLWMFGGQDGGTEFLNDLWEYDISSNTWIEHDNLFNGGVNNNGVYTGTQYPGSRWAATARMDSNGNVWMFGGNGYDSTARTPGLLNDLWEYNTATGVWTYVSGSKTANQSGVYGQLGVAAPGNVPGGRQASVSWLDLSGNFWIFGGYDLDSAGRPDALNDLWEFSGGQWKWVSGSSSVNQLGVYGTQGVTAATNVPGARYSAAAWYDLSGNFWLFGGEGYDATGNGSLADLWEFKGGQWTWVKGPSSVSQAGVYGFKYNPTIWPESTNNPGARYGPAVWSSINKTAFPAYDQFFLLGGQGFDSTINNGNGKLNDLWRYLPYP